MSEDDNISCVKRLGFALKHLLEKNGTTFELNITGSFLRHGYTIKNWQSIGVGLVWVSGYSVTFGISAISEEYVNEMLDITEQAFPDCIRVVVGTAVEQEKKMEEESYNALFQSKLVEVPGKYILNEVGERCFVPSFYVSRRPVSVEQFLEFTSETNYKTTAHLLRESKTFDSNELLKESTVSECPAVFLSRIDALSYCEWKKCRLPTESEYLSAWVLDWETFPPNSRMNFSQLIMKYENALVGGMEWTMTNKTDQNKGIIRRGPKHFLKFDWKNRERNLKEVHETYFDIMTSFRVIKND